MPEKRGYTHLDFEQKNAVWRIAKKMIGKHGWLNVTHEQEMEYPFVNMGDVWCDHDVAAYCTKKLGYPVSTGNVRGIRTHFGYSFPRYEMPAPRLESVPEPAAMQVLPPPQPVVTTGQLTDALTALRLDLAEHGANLAEHRHNTAVTLEDLRAKLDKVHAIVLALAKVWSVPAA